MMKYGASRSLGALAWFALAASIVAFAGCSKAEQAQTQKQIQRQASDAWTCTQVRAAATELDPATVSLIKISCAQGVVKLQGQVSSAQEQAELATAARKVDGVRTVIVNVTVNPKAPTGNEIADDLGIAAKVRVALAGQTGTNS